MAIPCEPGQGHRPETSCEETFLPEQQANGFCSNPSKLSVFGIVTRPFLLDEIKAEIPFLLAPVNLRLPFLGGADDVVSALEPTQLLEHEVNAFFHHPDLTPPVEHKRLALTELFGSGDLDELVQVYQLDDGMIAIIHWKDSHVQLKRSTDNFSEAVESWELIIVFALEAFLDVSDWDLAGDIVVDIDEALDHADCGKWECGHVHERKRPCWSFVEGMQVRRIYKDMLHGFLDIIHAYVTHTPVDWHDDEKDDYANTRIRLVPTCAWDVHVLLRRIKAKQHSGQNLLKRLHSLVSLAVLE